VGSAAAPGGAGEALVGQTSSSGVRLSDFKLMRFPPFSRSGCIMHAACQSLSLQVSSQVCPQVRLHLLATPRPRHDLF